MSPLKSHANSRNIGVQQQNCGIHSLAINPSRTLLATGAENVNDIAIYRLPSLQPLCVGYDAHNNWIFDSVWIDDTHVVSGAGDSKLALWSVGDEIENTNNPRSDDINAKNFIKNNSNNEEEEDSYSMIKRRRIDLDGKYDEANSYKFKKPTNVITCIKGKRIRALTYNKKSNEIAAVTMNASFHSFNSDRFEQVLINMPSRCD